MAGLFKELKRRNVVRVGVAYLVMSWIVMQIVDVLAQTLVLPDWFAKTVLAILLVGFPLALFFSWAFELTPQGVKKTEEVDADASIAPSTGRKLDFIIIGALVVALGYFVWERQGLIEGADGPQGPVKMTSIAVLPFVNMSADPEQEYFSDGITEELLNTLVKVPGLSVAARTSAFSYKGLNRDVREIGQELGVETIVEGSVRRAGDDLRITAQLVRVTDGFHMWSETYDRKYENVFAIQEEIAFAIADAVQAPLGLAAGSLVSSRMTNMAAFDQYLKARRLIRERGTGLAEAILILREVVAEEPKFAPAWAAMAVAKNVLPAYVSEFEGKPVNAARQHSEAELAARKAVALDPDLAAARHALANGLRDRGALVAAEDAYEKAMALDPGSIEILEDYSEFFGAVLEFDRAYELSEKAVALEPESPLALAFHADNLALTGRFDEAILPHVKALQIQPDFSWSGEVVFELYLLDGRPEKALAHLQANDGFWERHYMEVGVPKMDFGPLRKRVGGESWVPPEGWTGSHWSPIYAYFLGGDDLYLDALEYWVYVKSDAIFNHNFNGMARIRANERFKALALTTGLVDYWRERGWPKVCWPLGEYDFACGAARE